MCTKIIATVYRSIAITYRFRLQHTAHAAIAQHRSAINKQRLLSHKNTPRSRSLLFVHSFSSISRTRHSCTSFSDHGPTITEVSGCMSGHQNNHFVSSPGSAMNKCVIPKVPVDADGDARWVSQVSGTKYKPV